MTDFAPGLIEPERTFLDGPNTWETVSPSDTVNFTRIPRGIAVTAAGNVVLVDRLGNTWTRAFAAGEQWAGHPVRVNNTNTTATGIKALY